MSDKLLIINAGSSSLKFDVYDMPGEKRSCTGVAERIGQDGSSMHWHFSGKAAEQKKTDKAIPDHAAALKEVLAILRASSLGHPRIIAHRVVHGGDRFPGPVVITKEVKDAIHALATLAPLHNPVNLQCIEETEKAFPGMEQVAVFDTSFHHSLPERTIRYAIDEKYYKEDGVRAYGFHGINHQFVTGEAIAFLKNNNAKLISMHLGNGCSISAVHAGRSVENSMGFGPLNGLVMATRSGDIDPAAIIHLMHQHQISPEEMDTILNKHSGLKALCGMTDMRDICKAVSEGNKQAAFACELYAFRIRKYIGAYMAAMNGLDAIIFTGGIGENAAYIRELICKEMDCFGLHLDMQKNREQPRGIKSIHESRAKVGILIIPANEALEIARQSNALLSLHA